MSKKFRKKILKIITHKKIDVIHCNLISLFLLAKWLKKNPRSNLDTTCENKPL